MTSKKRRIAHPKDPAQKRSWLWAAFIGAAAILVVAALVLALQGRQATASYTPEVTGGAQRPDRTDDVRLRRCEAGPDGQDPDAG